MTSAYKRSNAVRTDSGGGGGVSRGKPHGGTKECHLFSAGLSEKNTHLYLSCQQSIGDVDLTLKIDRVYLKQNMKENYRGQELTAKNVAKKIGKERPSRARKKARKA